MLINTGISGWNFDIRQLGQRAAADATRTVRLIKVIVERRRQLQTDCLLHQVL